MYVCIYIECIQDWWYDQQLINDFETFGVGWRAKYFEMTIDILL